MRIECPLDTICKESWMDFTIGADGEKMDADCPMRQALETEILTERTVNFIRAKVYERVK